MGVLSVSYGSGYCSAVKVKTGKFSIEVTLLENPQLLLTGLLSFHFTCVPVF